MSGAVLFDLDGTLVDSHRDIAAALNDVLTALGQPTHAPAAVKKMIGGGVHHLLRRGVGEARLEEARALFRDAYMARLLETTRPYPGIDDLLDRVVAAGIGVAIATNKPRFYTEPVLEACGWSYPFACADEVPKKKPDPAVVALAMTRAGFDRAGAYVGDMPVDVQTAKNAGLRSIVVGWGFDPEGAAQAADDVADRPGQLEQLILGMSMV